MPENQSILETKRKYQEKLTKEYFGLYQDLSNASEAGKVGINLAIKAKESEIKDVAAEIEELEKEQGNSNSYRVSSTKWMDHLHKIDFKKARKDIQYVIDRLDSKKHQQEEALFLLQESRLMGGVLCIKHIEAYLQQIGTLTGYEFGFPPGEENDPLGFLHKLALKYNVPPENQASSAYIEKIIQAIATSLRPGNILFLQITICDLDAQDTFIEWIVQHFWHRLIDQMEVLRQTYPSIHPSIRVVGVIAVQVEVPKSCLATSLCCKKNNIDGRKILPLHLEKWTEDEIAEWLISFSGLDLPPVQIQRAAKTIYKISKGQPRSVQADLEEFLIQQIAI